MKRKLQKNQIGVVKILAHNSDRISTNESSYYGQS